MGLCCKENKRTEVKFIELQAILFFLENKTVGLNWNIGKTDPNEMLKRKFQAKTKEILQTKTLFFLLQRLFKLAIQIKVSECKL